MKCNEIICGFTVNNYQEIKELDAKLYQMEHKKSGARLVWLDRADVNKTFGIAFRTLPSDDTGVFHILEHSLLCGSERYPVKEPFVELMKSSMKTFLNAVTFPDKTFYPLSSRNDKDFLNLMRVYMDAVLHPRIYSKPEIFAQEGWHYELDEAGSPSYKGVVFNEMKGAFASPDTLVQNETFRLLFPDSSYRYVSGGDPAHIPELSYEQFLDSHRRFYHPSNAYIFMDGRLDLIEVLSILDGEYLSAFARVDSQPAFTLQRPVKSAPVKAYYEVSAGEDLQNRTRMVWGYVLGDFTCREEQIGIKVLADALCGSNQAPLKQKLLAAGLAQDISIQLMDSILQPYAILEVCNTDECRTAEVENAVFEELERLVREGLDHTQLAATLANLEFQMRERNYGRMPQGLVFGMQVLESWLYDGDPAANLEVGDLFASLNRKLEENYFEDLLERVFLKSEHCCQVTLLPSTTLGDEKRAVEERNLEEARRRWDEETLANLKDRQEALLTWQSSRDTPEAAASLPSLTLEDISETPEEIPMVVDTLCGRPLLRHEITTSGIHYVNLYFDVSDFSQEELSPLSFLCALLGNLDTVHYSTLELQKQCRLYLGNLNFQVEAYGRGNETASCRSYLCVSFSALDAKLEKAVSLVCEILTSTCFNDVQKLQAVLRQMRIQLEQNITGSGSSYALTRVEAGYSVQGVVREYTGGIAYCQWLKNLDANFESQCREMADTLRKIYAGVFEKNRLTASLTGSYAQAAAMLEKGLIRELPDAGTAEIVCSVRPWGNRKEGIVIPADVSFSALGGNLAACGGGYSGTMRVLGRVTSLAYLWNVIRVQGGAYGTGLILRDSGNACFYSYRDPGAPRSLECYRQTGQFLQQFCAARPDLTGFITGAVAESEPLMLPREQGKAADGFYLKGVRHEDRCRERREMLSATTDKLASLIAPLQAIGDTGSVCVVGSRKQIEACGAEIDTIFTL